MNTKNLHAVGRLTAAWLLSSSCIVALAHGDYRAVFVRDKQICITGPSKVVSCMPGDNLDKLLPVWSREGDRIAYIEVGATPSALATLFMIDAQGKKLGEVPLKVIGDGEIRSGMRQVEAVEWLSANRLVASGSVNPSSAEYLVVDTSRMVVVDELVSEGFQAAFSPDGLSYVAGAGQPHFTKKEARRPTLIVNGRRLSHVVPDQMEIAGSPSWSPNGSAVAIPVRYATSAPDVVDQAVLWLRDSEDKRSVVLPTNTRKLGWGASGLTAATAGQQASQVWELPIVTKPFQISGWRLASQSPSANAEAKQRMLTAELRSTVHMVAGSGIDIWCKGCDLAEIPRRVPKD